MASSKNKIKGWSFDHYIGFLLLYASHADYEYSMEEKQMIKSKVGKEVLEEVESYFECVPLSDHVLTLMNFRKLYIKTDADRINVQNTLKELWHSDGEFSRPEVISDLFLNNLLDLTTKLEA